MIALKWHKVLLKMEELANPPNLSSEDIKAYALVICKETVEKLLKTKAHAASKTFFVSLAHHFLERLIHLHSIPIKQLLNTLSKQMQTHFQGGSQQDKECLSWQQLFNIKEAKPESIDVMSIIKQLFGHLLGIECKGRTSFQRQNIFLEISCSLNYTCPLCIKKMEEAAPKSIKLIKYCSEQIQNAKQPQTLKVISCVQADRSSRMPSLSKPNKFQSILQAMKAEREASKKQDEKKLKKQNKVWNMLGQILDLDRQKYTIDHIFKQSKDKQNNLMKELNVKNIKNQQYILQFSKKMKAHRYELKENNVTADYFQTYQPPHQSKEKQAQKQSVSSKSRRNISLKKQVKILLPICGNSSRLSSIEQPKKMAQLTNQVGRCTYSYLTQKPAQNGRSVSKTLHFYRPFKSNRDVCNILSKQKYQPLDLYSQSFNKSLKII